MAPSPAASGLLPMPGSPSSSLALYRARLAAICKSTDTAVFAAFWFFGASHEPLRPAIRPDDAFQA